jgi:hypothetical protein
VVGIHSIAGFKKCCSSKSFMIFPDFQILSLRPDQMDFFSLH